MSSWLRFSNEQRERPPGTNQKCRRPSRVAYLLLSYLIATSLYSIPGALAQEKWRITATNTTSLIYSGDNRDDRVGEIETQVNDGWGALQNRLNLGANRGKWNFQLRIDGSYYYARPNPVQVGLDSVQLRNDQQESNIGGPDDALFFRQKVYEAGNELSNRTLNWLYPTKYSLSYGDPSFKVIVGDSYAQFGRGFVLSLRKRDELASDTTLRGLKLSASRRFENIRVKATLLAGSGNPLRIDEASGRYLGTSPSGTQGFQKVTELGMPWAVATDYAPNNGDCQSSATCSYAPDNLYGAQVEIAPKGFRLSSQASLLTRQLRLSEDIVRSTKEMITASQSFELSGLEEYGNLYLEGVGQARRYERQKRSGYALYASLDLYLGDVTLSAEAKHYRRFYPLSAGISVNRAREFSQVQYSTPPTTEPIWTDTQFEFFNTCVSGGRLRSDWELNQQLIVYSYLGRFDSWAESVSNEECELSSDNKNRVWDAATGLAIDSSDGLSNHKLRFGIRDDQTARKIETEFGATNVFYREAYSRFDLLFHIKGPYSVQLIGWHRYRQQTVGGPNKPYGQGQQQVALEMAPRLNLAFSFEYDLDPRTPDTYINGQLTYRLNSASNFRLFAGQRRGAQRCVAGVCRVFPPFEGTRLDFTLRL